MPIHEAPSFTRAPGLQDLEQDEVEEQSRRNGEEKGADQKR